MYLGAFSKTLDANRALVSPCLVQDDNVWLYYMSLYVTMLPYTRVNKPMRLFAKLQGNMRLILNSEGKN